MAIRVEIISVGNELLIGKTLNTNAQWLARRLTSLGFSVSRIVTIGDNVKEIADALGETVSRNPRFIITTGGLGPTFDDRTLEGIAEAFNSKLQINEQALKMVEEKYASYAKEMDHEKFELTQARVKMAKIPKDAEPLPNPVGTAPAVAIKKNNVTVFALPGVPSEMKAIFENSLLPVLKAEAGNLTYFETSFYVKGVMESEMAPLIDQVMHDNPRIYIKSHPMGTEKKPQIELHLSTTAEDVEIAKKRVGRALMQLSEMVRAKGGKTATNKAKIS
ncbi:MAG: nicotinamide mononucleotide deamidase-related protein [Candidatus Bathyarchaeia archaeon]